MYDYIIGKITYIKNNAIVVDNNGIGYLVYVSNPYSFEINNEYKVYIYQHITEDENTLYGFKTIEEKDLFLKLISVKGLGCKMALPILAVGEINGIMDAIERENILYLKKFPKIGDKLARQMILDLKGKLEFIGVGISDDQISIENELKEVLLGLGYKEKEIIPVLAKVDTSLPIEGQVKDALKLLLRKVICLNESVVKNYNILDDNNLDNTIRPETIEEYVGQSDVKENIKVFVSAAKMRNEALDHVLLYGPPGLGKTTLAFIIAHELGTNIKTASGPSIEKSGDLAAILSSLEPGDVLFIDEIHRMPRYIEEILYPAMEDFSLDIIVGSEGNSRNIKIDLPPFTLVGATTRAGDLSSPLRDRFGIVSKLQFYTVEELSDIIKRTSRVLEMPITDEAAMELATRSRGTPRIANRLFKRVRDFAMVDKSNEITKNITEKALDRLKVDKIGLDNTDRELLLAIINKFNGGPVGIEALSSSIGEEVTTIEDVYEPYLLQMGLLKRTSRGRVVTDKTYEILGIEKH